MGFLISTGVQLYIGIYSDKFDEILKVATESYTKIGVSNIEIDLFLLFSPGEKKFLEKKLFFELF